MGQSASRYVDEGTRQRYVLVSYCASRGYYALLCTNQGRFHFDEPSEALEAAEDLRPSLADKLGIDPSHVKVIHAECWAHGDCCRTIFPTELVAELEVK